MKLYNPKLLIGIFILLAYISIGVFGLLQFNHMTEAPMENCPYTQNGHAICKDKLDHISSWQQFSNFIFPTLLVLLLLVSGIGLYLFGKKNLLNQKPYLFYKWKDYLDNKKSYLYLEKINRWLSLLVNSPSLLQRT
jgi:hypothetical protein